jgi:hypothetical protein
VTGFDVIDEPPIGVDGELVRWDLMARHRVGDQLLGELAGLRRRHAPGHDVAAEDVEHHVEVVVDAAFRALELRDVPAPHDQRRAGDELGADLGGVRGLAAALPHLVVGPQDAVVAGFRSQIDALVEEREVHLRRRAVGEALRSQRVEHGGDLVV